MRQYSIDIASSTKILVAIQKLLANFKQGVAKESSTYDLLIPNLNSTRQVDRYSARFLIGTRVKVEWKWTQRTDSYSQHADHIQDTQVDSDLNSPVLGTRE